MYKDYVTLSPDAIEVSRFLADRRFRRNRAAGIRGYMNTTKQAEIDKESLSILGEMGFAKLLNCYYALSQDTALAGAPDFLTPTSKQRVEIKTAGAGRDLCVNKYSMRNIRDYYVLMEASKSREHVLISFVGYTISRVVRSSELIESASSPFYRVRRYDLIPFYQFKESIWL